MTLETAALGSHMLQSGTPKFVVSDPLPVQEVEQRAQKTIDDSQPSVLSVSEHPLRQRQEAEQQWKRQAADFRHVNIKWQQASIDVDSRLTPSLNLLSSFLADRPYRNRGTLLTHLGQPELVKDIYSDHDHLTVMYKLVPANWGGATIQRAVHGTLMSSIWAIISDDCLLSPLLKTSCTAKVSR